MSAIRWWAPRALLFALVFLSAFAMPWLAEFIVSRRSDCPNYSRGASHLWSGGFLASSGVWILVLALYCSGSVGSRAPTSKRCRIRKRIQAAVPWALVSGFHLFFCSVFMITEFSGARWRFESSVFAGLATVPMLWMPLVLVIGVSAGRIGGWSYARWVAPLHPDLLPMCSICSYSLRGCTSDYCPECGSPVPSAGDESLPR